MNDRIHFGTDGWRGIIADDFTFDNVRRAAAAIARYVLENETAEDGVCVAYDTRFNSKQFARAAAEVIAAAGIPVRFADRITPTPALSHAVKRLGAAGGVMITSSHNPYQWNGVKYKASYGGSGSPSIMAAIERYVHMEAPPAAKGGPAGIVDTDFLTPYVSAISSFVDLGKIARARHKYAIDCMYGAGRGVLAGIFNQAGINHIEIRGNIDPLFSGINPEPIEPHILALQQAVVEHRCQAGFCTDGDADRIGAVDECGGFVDAHKIFSVILEWLLKRKQWPGGVTRAFNTTNMLDRIAAKYGRRLYEHGIGFKYVCDLMLEEEILIGGEESGGIGISKHLPERDGLLNSLLLANVMAEENRTLGQLVEALQQEYGEHQYGRIDLTIAEEAKQSAIARAAAGIEEFAGMKVLRKETLDGIKFYLENPEAKHKPRAAESWLLFRASGTEPLLRIYAESCSRESVKRLLDAGRSFALNGSEA